MIKNAVCGIAAAKACGIGSPTVGILNVDGARQVERCAASQEATQSEFASPLAPTAAP